MRRIRSPCCALAASGHAAAPPSSAMKSRRLMCGWPPPGKRKCSVRHRSGREVIVDSRMQLLRDGTVLEVNRDVTEVKALGTRQAALMRDLLAAGAKFEAVFNQSGIFAGIMDLQGRLREVNDLAVQWCGYTREQVLDQPFSETPWWRGSE